MRTTRRQGRTDQLARAQLAPLIATGQAVCWRCDRPIAPDEPWDAGHRESIALGGSPDARRVPEHRHCNRSAGARLGKALRANPSTRRRLAAWLPDAPRESTPRQVWLIVGPPASGKSTWVGEHSAPDDLVVDFDQIAQRLGSPVEHGHAPNLIRRASIEQRRLESSIAAMEFGTAWVIRTGTDPARRARLAARLRADVVVVDPGRDVVLDRCRTDRHAQAIEEVQRWYAAN